MDYVIELNPDTTPILAKGVMGMANVQYVLDLTVEEWLNGNAPGWNLEGGNRGWDHIPELQVWYNYRNASSGETWIPGPARFGFVSADHAVLFKLTWG